MRLSRLSIQNYKALRDVTIPLSRFGCLIGENNSGKSSFVQALSLFLSGSKLQARHFFDDSLPIRIAVSLQDITESDLALLAPEHKDRVTEIVQDGCLDLVRLYDTGGKSSLMHSALVPKDGRFEESAIADLLKGSRPGKAFVAKVVSQFPELDGQLDSGMTQSDVRTKIDELARSLPDDQKQRRDVPLPTGIDKSIVPMLPQSIYIPAVKDLSDDIKTTESTPFGRILAILLRAVESRLPDYQRLFEELNSKLNRVTDEDGKLIDNRLDEVRLIEQTVEGHLRETFADVALRISIPPPELKAVFSSANIHANDGVEGHVDTKGDGLRRAVVFSILRSYVELSQELGRAESSTGATESAQSTSANPAPPSYLLLFEEPELFLHPTAQRILFESLKAFSKDNHVVVTTHSPMFFGPNATETFVKLRKTRDPSVAPKPYGQALQVDLSDLSAKDQFQLICFENNNAAFFAEKIVLVEGDSDYLVMPHIAKTLNPTWDAAKGSVHFSRIMGKGNIKKYRSFFSRFGASVAVIADLDVLVRGFDHVPASQEAQSIRSRLLARADTLVEGNTTDEAVTGREARKALDSLDLKGRWRRVKEGLVAYRAGSTTIEQLQEAVEAFYDWQKTDARLDVLMESKDVELTTLKWELLHELRQNDVYVLEKGAIEAYYPAGVSGSDKPTKAQGFCDKASTAESILNCCTAQTYREDGKEISKKEFEIIFERIFRDVASHAA